MFAAQGSRRLLWLSVFVIVLDQYSKWVVVRDLEYARPIRLNDWFDLTRLHNTGAAFSFLSDGSGWQRWFFVALAVSVSAFIFLWLGRVVRGTQRALAVGLALIMGGALGNVIDRVNHGYVIDFIHLHYGDWYWPAFNVADMAITAGAVLLVIDTLFGSEPAES